MSCCNQGNDQKPSVTDADQAVGPMAKGMGMGKKMMGQGDGPPMQQMMGMCSEMLGAMGQTTGMAAFATPELRHTFGAWLKELEGKAEAAIADGEKDAAGLAAALGINEDSARYVLGQLAANNKVTLVGRLRT